MNRTVVRRLVVGVVDGPMSLRTDFGSLTRRMGCFMPSELMKISPSAETAMPSPCSCGGRSNSPTSFNSGNE